MPFVLLTTVVSNLKECSDRAARHLDSRATRSGATTWPSDSAAAAQGRPPVLVRAVWLEGVAGPEAATRAA